MEPKKAARNKKEIFKTLKKFIGFDDLISYISILILDEISSK
jgi:hypothetical protein